MNTHYEARLEALRMAQSLSGSQDYKMKMAEEFYQFLSQGIGLFNSYPYYGTITPTQFTLPANDTIIVSNGQ